MDKTELVEALFQMLEDYGAPALEITAEDNDGIPLGMILVLSAEAAPEFRKLARKLEARGDFVR